MNEGSKVGQKTVVTEQAVGNITGRIQSAMRCCDHTISGVLGLQETGRTTPDENEKLIEVKRLVARAETELTLAVQKIQELSR